MRRILWSYPEKPLLYYSLHIPKEERISHHRRGEKINSYLF